jgi:hypothetical protein
VVNGTLVIRKDFMIKTNRINLNQHQAPAQLEQAKEVYRLYLLLSPWGAIEFSKTIGQSPGAAALEFWSN